MIHTAQIFLDVKLIRANAGAAEAVIGDAGFELFLASSENAVEQLVLENSSGLQLWITSCFSLN